MKKSRLLDRVYTRLLAEQEQENLVKDYVRTVMQDESLLSEWDLALSYAKGNFLLSESANARGKLIVEALMPNLDAAINWVGQKTGSAWQKLKSVSGEALDSAGKALMLLFESIAGGKEAFEMIKSFSGEAADKIQSLVEKAIKEFSAFIESKKKQLLEIVLSGVDSVKSKIDELMKKAEKKPAQKAFLDACKKHSVSDAIKVIMGDGRVEVAPVASVLVMMILDTNQKVKKKLEETFENFEFFKSKLGTLTVRLMALLSSDMSGEDVIVAASKLWQSIGGIMKGAASDVSDSSKELIQSIPSIVKGLVSGSSPIESIIRITIGDPTAAVNLLKNAIKTIMKSLSKVVDKKGPDILKKLKIDPDGKIGKAILAGMKGLIGSGGGTAAASAI